MVHKCPQECAARYCQCKFKFLVNAIETSCHSMKQCLTDNKKLEAFSNENETETRPWPCNICYESLKGIKMMWKVIFEKLLNANISKAPNSSSNGSVHSVLSTWQSELEVQVDIVKKGTNKEERIKFREDKIIQSHKTSQCLGTNTYKSLTQQNVDVEICTLKKSSGCLSLAKKTHCYSKGDSFKDVYTFKDIDTVDKASNTCYFLEEMIELDMYKKKLTQLEDELSININKVDTLSKENEQLKSTLEKINEKNDVIVFLDTVTGLKLKQEESSKLINPLSDSETIITVQNCSHQTYKHVSLLQVLHKSNEPISDGFCCEETEEKDKKDPIDLLKRVQNAVGEIVKREVKMINTESKRAKRKSEINASYHKIKVAKSMLSFKSLSTCSLSNVKSSLES